MKYKVVDLVYIALGAVIIAVCSWISIPTLVPFTLQTFAVFCVLELLGGRRGTAAIAIYILLGAIGVPVFSNFSGGLSSLLGMTGGYIIGFLLIGGLYWLAGALLPGRLSVRIGALTLGLALCYAFGTAWFMLVYAGQFGPIGFGAALMKCVVPFIIPDAVKMALAMLLAARLKKALARQQSGRTAAQG